MNARSVSGSRFPLRVPFRAVLVAALLAQADPAEALSIDLGPYLQDVTPDSKLLVIGDRKGVENRYVVFRRADRVQARTRGFPHRGYTSGDLRLDGSPCWNRTSDAFLFPAIAADGTRQLFVARITHAE